MQSYHFLGTIPILKRHIKTKALTKHVGLDRSEFKMLQKNDELEGLFCKFKPVQTILFDLYSGGTQLEPRQG